MGNPCHISFCEWGGSEPTVQLDKTVVTSVTGFETDVRKVMASPTVVTAEQIKEKNYKSVVEALEDIPAINIINNTFGSIIDMRGQGDGVGGAKANVQILVDGVAVNSLETSMSSSPINTVSIDNIERIEVIPGGGAVMYGSGTAGGVVNIITKRGEGLRANAGYSRTSFDGDKYDVSAGTTIGKFDFDLAYTNNKAEGYRDNARDDSEYFQGKVRYDINENHNIEFKFSNYNAHANILEFLSKDEINSNRKQGEIEEYMKTEKDDYTLTYNGKLSDNIDVNVIAFHTDTNMGMDMLQAMNMHWDFKDKKIGIKPKLKYTYGNDSSVIFGVDYIENEGGRYQSMPMGSMVIKMSSMDLEKDTTAGFIMNNYKIGKFEFNQGVRYEKSEYHINRGNLNDDTDEDNYAWELSGNYNYSDTGRTYLRYERGFTTPGPGLLTNKYNGNYYLNGIEPSTYNSVEFGLSDYKGFTAINVSLFYSLTDDEIYTGGMTNNIISYNLDKTQRYGAEIKLEQYLGKLTLSQSYQYINAEIKDGKEKDFDSQGNTVYTGVDISGNEIANVPKHKFTLGAKYDFTSNLNINGEVVYNGETYINNANTAKRDDYIVTNIRANYNLDCGLSLYAGINNLFDEEYYNEVSYSNGEYSYDPAAERNYYVGFSYTY